MAKKFYYQDQKVKAHSRTSPKSKKKIDIKSYDRRQKFRKYSFISQKEAKKLFDKRSQRSKTMDLKTTSNKVLTVPDERWAENTGRSDVKGIDTKKEKLERKTIKAEYLLDNRPIDLGTVPDSDKIIKSENWKPSKENHFTFGSVQYDDNLTFEQIYKYELRPKDEVEYANYMFWLKNDKDLASGINARTKNLKVSTCVHLAIWKCEYVILVYILFQLKDLLIMLA